MSKNTMITVGTVLLVGAVLAYMIKKNMEPATAEHRLYDTSF
jgi:uncharacterized membrane protein